MITDFSAQPKPQNNKAKIVMWVFFAIAAVAFVASTIIGQYKGVVGMVCVAAITTAILMYTKFVSVKFHYDVLAAGMEEPLFVVRQVTGKRETTVARVALADIVDIRRESAAERRAHKREKTTALFVYAPTFSPEYSYRMYIKTRYDSSEVILEGSDEFFDKIKEFAAEARTLRATQEAEEEY